MVKLKVFQVGPMRNNSALLFSEETKEGFVIDPSLAYTEIANYASKNNITISKVFLTHGHYDHIYDASLFQAIGAKIFAHENSEYNINSPLTKLNLKRIGKSLPQINTYIKEGDVFKLGNDILQVLYTPGHSACSCSFIINNYLFPGDTLFKHSYGRYDFFDSSFEDLKTSIGRLFKINQDLEVFPGHEESTFLSLERKNNPFLFYL